MREKTVFEVCTINRQGKEVDPDPEFFPDFYELLTRLVSTEPSAVLNFLRHLDRTFREEDYTVNTLNVFIVPEDREQDEYEQPLDMPGDIVLSTTTNHMVNGTAIKVFFTIAPEEIGTTTSEVLGVTDKVPPNRII